MAPDDNHQPELNETPDALDPIPTLDPASIAENQPAGRWRVAALVPADGREPASTQSDTEAESIWAAVTAGWHPAILAACADLPGIECVEYPDHPHPNEIRLISCGAAGRLPSDYRVLMADRGAPLIEATRKRTAVVRQILDCLPDAPSPKEVDPIADGFLALGAAWWWLRDLTTAMGHPDCLDHDTLRREVLEGARAWRKDDVNAATNRLRAAFEMLTQARERFYPIDAYILDLCLLDPSAPPGSLADNLDARAPLTLLAPARAIEALANRDPEQFTRLRDAIAEGWADVIGGTYGEADDPLRPVESVLWQFRRGAETYRRHLEDRTTETFARRRFGLYPMLPQIARRFGFRFAAHCGFDDGRFPVPPDAKRLWDAPDGSQLEALTRPPIAAERVAEATKLPWRLAKSMKEDHVATLALVSWPDRHSGWYRDLRRVATFSPVFARWVTASDYFHLTDRPYESYRPTLDQYVFPYLDQSVAQRQANPISQRVVRASLRTRLDAALCLHALDGAIESFSEADPTNAECSERAALLRDIEDELESGRFDDADLALDSIEPKLREAMGRSISSGTSAERPGYLILNPSGVPRRAAVLLADAAADLRPEGPLLAAQFTEGGVQAIVDIPAFGFAWVPRDAQPEREPTPFGVIGARGRVLYNEHLEVEIDEATGGIRALRAPSERAARLGQRLVMRGLGDVSLTDSSTTMTADRFEVEYGGPALVQAVVEGRLLESEGGRTLGRFRQCYRLFRNRPILEIEITLADLDPVWCEQIAGFEPWKRHLACRWAWPDADAELRRTSHLAPYRTTAQRPETPDAIDITSGGTRTTLLFGGLAHHQRHGARMLDTLLIAGRESERTFRLGIALEQDSPSRAAQDFLGSVVVVPTSSGPPATGPLGWLLQIDQRSVAVTRVEPLQGSGDGPEFGRGLACHLLETTGRATRCRLRLLRNPIRARQADFQGEKVLDLVVEGDTVLLDLTPHELARVEVVLFDALASVRNRHPDSLDIT